MYNPTPVFCDACGQANRPQARFCYNCGQPLQVRNTFPSLEAQDSATGPATTGNLGANHLLKQRYRIIGQLGHGGMGAVYKAEDTQFGDRLVAVKEMSQLGLSPEEVSEAAEAFKHEALLLAGLMHPNLPRIYDHFGDEGQWYLVMDFVQGETLEEHLNRQMRTHPGLPQGLVVPEVLDIGIQLSSVLSYLHTRKPPIIFRDLKPDNVMLTSEGHVYLIDFGIARHFKPGQLNDTKAFVSWGYASPEQYGKSQTTPRSDIYSLGATLHHLLTGNNPTHTPFRFAPLQTHTHPAQIELEKLLMLMVSIEENQRPGTMAAIKQELQRISALQVTEQLGSQIGSQTLPPASNQTLPPDEQESAQAAAALEQVPSKTTRPPQGTKYYVYHGHSDRVFALNWSPDGKRIVSGGYDHTLQVWDAATGREIFSYRGHSDPVRAAAWSPDGKAIASASNDHTAHVWAAANGRKIAIFRGHSDSVTSISWSPDHKQVASASLSKTALVWDAASAARIAILRGHSSLINAVSWSPDGKRIATASLDKTVRVHDAGTWQVVFVYRGHSDSVRAVVWSPDSQYLASASEDKTVQVWDATSGDHIFTYNNHVDEVTAVAWSADGKRIASSGEDRTVQVWDAASGDHIFTYHEHPEDVNAVVWSPDSTRIASTGDDGSVHVWQAV